MAILPVIDPSGVMLPDNPTSANTLPATPCNGAAVEVVPPAPNAPKIKHINLSAGAAVTVDVQSFDAAFRKAALATSTLNGYYRFDEAAGVVWGDSSPNSFNGSYVNAPNLGLPGLIVVDPDTAVQFPGPGGPGTPYSTVVNALQLVSPVQGSIFYRLQAQAAAGNHFMTCCIGEGTDGFHVKLNPGNDDLEIVVFNSGAGMSANVVTGGANISDLAIHDVGLRWNGASWDFFFDGAFVGNTVLPATMGNIAGKDFFCGGQDVGLIGLGGGTVDEMIFSGDQQPDAWFASLHALAVAGPAIKTIIPAVALGGAPFDFVPQFPDLWFGVANGNLQLANASNATPISGVFETFD